MDWPQKITGMLKKYKVDFINYVPDAIGEKLLRLMRDDKDFHLVPLTREEEGVGIAAGQAISGGRPLLLMPTSAFNIGRAVPSQELIDTIEGLLGPGDQPSIS